MGSKEALAFGRTVRLLRESRDIGLRELCRAVGISATYLSQVERGQLAPPSEAKVRAIAKALGADPEDLLERAGRVPSDLDAVIRRHPREMAALLRAVRGLPVSEIGKLRRRAEQMRASLKGGRR